MCRVGSTAATYLTRLRIRVYCVQNTPVLRSVRRSRVPGTAVRQGGVHRHAERARDQQRRRPRRELCADVDGVGAHAAHDGGARRPLGPGPGVQRQHVSYSQIWILRSLSLGYCKHRLAVDGRQGRSRTVMRLSRSDAACGRLVAREHWSYAHVGDEARGDRLHGRQ